MGATGGDVGHIIQDEGSDLAKRKKLNFSGAGVTVTDDSGNDASKVTITSGGGGEANTSSNVGTGQGLAKPKVGVDLPFKSLIGDTEIVLTGNLNDVTFSIAAAIARLTTKLDDFGTPDDNTDLDATTILHGLFPKVDKVKLDGIAALAEVNPDLISQAEAEAGSATTERIFSALRVKQAIDALGGGGGGGTITLDFKALPSIPEGSTAFHDIKSYGTFGGSISGAVFPDGATEDTITYKVNVPSTLAGTPNAKIVLRIATINAIAANATRWQVKSRAISDGESINVAPLTDTAGVDVAMSASASIEEELVVNMNTVPTAGDHLFILVKRLSNHANDNYVDRVFVTDVSLRIDVQ